MCAVGGKGPMFGTKFQINTFFLLTPSLYDADELSVNELLLSFDNSRSKFTRSILSPKCSGWAFFFVPLWSASTLQHWQAEPSVQPFVMEMPLLPWQPSSPPTPFLKSDRPTGSHQLLQKRPLELASNSTTLDNQIFQKFYWFFVTCIPRKLNLIVFNRFTLKKGGVCPDVHMVKY